MTPKITYLDNGFRIVSENWQRLETVSVGIWVDAGSRHEPASLNGIAHFIEHMLFKGTEKRSAQQIAEEIEEVGGHLNAYTSRDQTTYYARVLKEDVALAVDIIGDIIVHSRFDEAETTRERDVILQEIGQAEDTPDDIIFDHLQACIYGDQALSRPILGSQDTVRAITAKALRQHRDETYCPSNMILAAVGNVDHDALVVMAEKIFGALPVRSSQKITTAQYIGGMTHQDRPLEQLHITLGFLGVSLHDDGYYAMQVFSTLLGGGMSSRLFQEVREKRGLAYSIYSFTSSHDETGFWGIYAGTSAEMANELLGVVADVCKDVLETLSEAEVLRAKTQLKAGLMMAMESTTTRVEQLARQLMVFDRLVPTQEVLDGIDAVDGAAIKALLMKSLTEAPMSMAYVGPKGGMPSSKEVAAKFKL